MEGPAPGRETLRGFERSLPIALLRAREATMRLFKPHVDSCGLTLPQWRVIRALADSGEMDATDLAERCVIMPPSLSRIIRALAERGLIARESAAGDARRLQLRLTGAGRALYDRFSPESERIYRRLEQEFGAERVDTLLRLLDDLRACAERQAGGAD